MGYQSITPGSAIADTAAFRVWGSAIATAVAALGYDKIGAGGGHVPIDWAAVAKSGSANNAAGSEVYPMEDSLQATDPLSFQLHFGTSIHSATIGGLWVNCYAVNGGITNAFFGGASILAHGVASYASTQMSLWGNPAKGYFGLLAHYLGEATKAPYLIVFERLRDAAGALAPGVYLSCAYTGHATAAPTLACWRGASPQDRAFFASANDSIRPLGHGPGETTWINGSDIVLAPVFPSPRVSAYPLKSVVGYFDADIAAGTEFDVTREGETVTYKALGGGDGLGFTLTSIGGQGATTIAAAGVSAKSRLAVRID